MTEPALFGNDLFGQAGQPAHKRGALAQRFGIPPFTVLDARSGAWQVTAGRKLGKAHQNVLVFSKGDWKRAAEACRSTEEERSLTAAIAAGGSRQCRVF